jgi:hypothetical protein
MCQQTEFGDVVRVFIVKEQWNPRRFPSEPLHWNHEQIPRRFTDGTIKIMLQSAKLNIRTNRAFPENYQLSTSWICAKKRALLAESPFVKNMNGFRSV